MDKCYECGNKLIDAEIKYYNEHAEYCCNGHECGCMGMPIEPPYCFDCISKGLRQWQERINVSLDKAYKIANNAIYFNDSSDYLTALYEVCTELKPEIDEDGCGTNYGIKYIE